MPLYDYQCLVCGHTQEEQRTYEARNNDVDCQKCGQRSIKKPTAANVPTYRHGNKARRHAREENLGEV